jgi:hypothetical protein
MNIANLGEQLELVEHQVNTMAGRRSNGVLVFDEDAKKAIAAAAETMKPSKDLDFVLCAFLVRYAIGKFALTLHGGDTLAIVDIDLGGFLEPMTNVVPDLMGEVLKDKGFREMKKLTGKPKPKKLIEMCQSKEKTKEEIEWDEQVQQKANK